VEGFLLNSKETNADFQRHSTADFVLKDDFYLLALAELLAPAAQTALSYALQGRGALERPKNVSLIDGRGDRI